MRRHAAFAGGRQRGGTALTVLLVLVVLVIAAVFILPIGFSYYFTNKMIAENPQLSSLPEPLPAAPPLKAKPTICYDFRP
jgi:cell division protein FtsN